MSVHRQPLPAATARNRRDHDRTALRLPGQLYVPAGQSAQSCTVTDLSAGGVRLACEDMLPVATLVILHIEGFGRFEAVTVRFTDGALSLRFACSQARQKRLLKQIDAFLDSGVSAAAWCGLKLH